MPKTKPLDVSVADPRRCSIRLFWMDIGRKKYTPRKEEFIGWGSKKLLFFLASIGRSVNEPISQSEVYDIVVDYIKENNLFDPQKKKKVICDANLRSLLRRKSINKNRISGLLETHFPENQQSDDESPIGSCNELEDETISVARKRQRSDVQISKSVSVELNEMALEARKHCFASITEKNIKLVYLRRSLLEKFVQTPETIESKVVDCIIRVKADNCYHFPKAPFQLVQVTGIERASKSYRTGDVSTDIVLKVSNAMKDIQIFMASDDDFTEEECKELRDRIKEGHLKRPTVGEMEEKARSLHEDITNHQSVTGQNLQYFLGGTIKLPDASMGCTPTIRCILKTQAQGLNV
ncbi:hypothetical protein ACLOJK_025549 [Asimina triloba]